MKRTVIQHGDVKSHGYQYCDWLFDGDDLIATTYGSADFREGLDAFLSKRKPTWTGK